MPRDTHILPAPTPTASGPVAIGFIIAGSSVFAVMDGLSQLLAADYTVAQVLWARFALFFVPMLVLLGPRRVSALARTDQLGLQIARAGLPVAAGLLVVLGLKLLPLTDTTAILFMAPLLVAILSIPLLGERVTAMGWAAVAAGFFGVLVIVRPGAGAVAWAALLPLGAASLAALYQIATRALRNADPLSTLLYTGLVGTVATSLVVPFSWQAPSRAGWVLLAVTGILHGLGHYLWILAFARAPASRVAPFAYSQMIAAVIFSLAVFGQRPDAITLAGAVIIVGAGLVAWQAQRQGRPA